ncbi:MAG: neutral/alkaline non-lysosomal ceramidase N-terminal domain-containing protein, partial [Kiritimatiellaeota bacterium]|nr:neutral/alkaline non-lysosomal ceramidase N-terminal domain-containing protein [Kiritimatiellota bacterium]
MKNMTIIKVAGVIVVLMLGVARAATPGLRARAAPALNMPGGFSANMAEGVNDPLHARAIMLDDGAMLLALVVVDNLGVAREVCDEAKALAAQRCPIKPENVLVCATHTHSAPSSNTTNGPAPAVAYRKLLVAGIAEAMVRAHAALRPAAVGVAAQPLPEEVFNRRWYLKPDKMPLNPFGKMDKVKTNPGTSLDVLDHPAGPTDPDITVLSLQEAKGHKPLALLANYSLHYVGDVGSGHISADYFGAFADRIQQLLGADRQDPP